MLHYFAFGEFIFYLIFIAFTIYFFISNKHIVKDIFKYSKMSLINKIGFVALPFVLEAAGAVMAFSLI